MSCDIIGCSVLDVVRFVFSFFVVACCEFGSYTLAPCFGYAFFFTNVADLGLKSTARRGRRLEVVPYIPHRKS